MKIIDFLLGYKSGLAAGGGKDLRYVTFMSHDGTVELGKKPVATGDDCADPIARGIFDTPTRESTDQYSYAFVGWATTPGGAWDSTVFEKIEEDKTLYAVFAAAVRYYTITYYDDDGESVLKTESLAYGAMPSYEPEKTGVTLEGWEPALAKVTGDASYTAVWGDVQTLDDMSWADIAAISEAGRAAEFFRIGDTKSFTVSGFPLTAVLIAFNHDNHANQGGKAGMTFAVKPGFGSSTVGASFSDLTGTTPYKTLQNTDLPKLPDALTQHIKPVLKPYVTHDGKIRTLTDSIWFFSWTELGFTNAAIAPAGQGTWYSEYFNSLASLKMAGSSLWYTRSARQQDTANLLVVYPGATTQDVAFTRAEAGASSKPYRVFGFCI